MKSLYECVVQITLAFIALYGAWVLGLLYTTLDNLERYNG